jgi:hypothetical protein
MSFEPPPEMWPLRAGDLSSNGNPPYLFKARDDDDSQWNLVNARPIYRLVPTPDRDAFLPPEVTVMFADGTARLFNPDDLILIGPTIK